MAPLYSITTTEPFELVSIDFVHLEESSGGYQYILTVVDNFFRYLKCYATRNNKAVTAAHHLFNDYFARFGMPKHILHDQGKQFENNLFKELNKLCRIDRLKTTPSRPMGNSQGERMNSIILSLLITLDESQKSKWKDQL